MVAEEHSPPLILELIENTTNTAETDVFNAITKQHGGTCEKRMATVPIAINSEREMWRHSGERNASTLNKRSSFSSITTILPATCGETGKDQVKDLPSGS